jgi:putative membrane protein
MAVPSASGSAPYPDRSEWEDPRRWLFGGLAALFVLIGLAVVVSVTVSIWRGQSPYWMNHVAPWNWFFGLIGLVIVLLILFWLLRVAFWFASGRAYDRRAYRAYRRGYYRGDDSAVTIARERYARGEISKAQFDQILRDLGAPPP